MQNQRMDSDRESQDVFRFCIVLHKTLFCLCLLGFPGRSCVTLGGQHGDEHMSLWKRIFGAGTPDAPRTEELNVAFRVDGCADHSDTCDVRNCWNCGCKVWVNKRLRSDARVCCMECAEAIVGQKKKTPVWRFPLE